MERIVVYLEPRRGGRWQAERTEDDRQLRRTNYRTSGGYCRYLLCPVSQLPRHFNATIPPRCRRLYHRVPCVLDLAFNIPRGILLQSYIVAPRVGFSHACSLPDSRLPRHFSLRAMLRQGSTVWFLALVGAEIFRAFTQGPCRESASFSQRLS